MGETGPVMVCIERLVAGGDGLGRLEDGRAVFVPGTAPGERVRAEVVRDRKTFLRARLLEVLDRSPGRRPLPCPHAPACGGCPWLHMDAPTQRSAKAEVLREALERTAGLVWREEIAVHPSPEEAWRDRVQWKIDLRHAARIGFHASRSHDVVDVSDCLLVPPEALAPLPAWRAMLQEERSLLRGLEDLVHDIEAPAGGHLTFRFGRHGPNRPESLRPLAKRILEAGGVDGVSALLPEEEIPVPLAGEAGITRRVGGFDYALHGGVFFQVNAPLREALQQRVVEHSGTGGRALDLCCGVGFFSLPLAGAFDEVLGVEQSAEAVRLARANAEANGLTDARFLEEPVERWLEAGTDLRPDAVVADPPRAGLGARAAQSLASMGQARTVLVACDPVSLARDLGPFLEGGHALRSLEVFDLFPGTPHLEAVALLQRGSSTAS